MTDTQWAALLQTKLRELCWAYPALRELMDALQLPDFPEMPLSALPDAVSDRWLRDRGYNAQQLLALIRDTLAEEDGRETRLADQEAERRRLLETLESLTICGGHDKDGAPEEQRIVLRPGDTVCVTGPTGSGKSRLLEDIECMAAGDTPSGRTLLLNGRVPTPRTRELLENRLCAYLSQSMNFVMELSCREFVLLHARCRGLENGEELLQRILACANTLAGEAFGAETPVTQLSGGQSRAFMIADLVHISAAPVVLIDEPENAGIDKHAVIELLSGSGKIVLISTHDPVLALSCGKRLTLKNGAIAAAQTRSPEEEALLTELRQMDAEVQRVREALRGGEPL